MSNRQPIATALEDNQSLQLSPLHEQAACELLDMLTEEEIIAWLRYRFRITPELKDILKKSNM